MPVLVTDMGAGYLRSLQDRGFPLSRMKEVEYLILLFVDEYSESTPTTPQVVQAAVSRASEKQISPSVFERAFSSLFRRGFLEDYHDPGQFGLLKVLLPEAVIEPLQYKGRKRPPIKEVVPSERYLGDEPRGDFSKLLKEDFEITPYMHKQISEGGRN